MKKIGLIDYFIDEWHSNTYLGLFERAAEELKLNDRISYAWAELDRFEGRLSTKEWCEAKGIEMCQTIEEICEQSDHLLILAPANPEKHLPYAEKALRYGKATYIDKTFAENVESAKKIYEVAARYGTPIFSTSALRYADELAELGTPESMIITGGGRSIEEYIIHQIEMAVKTLGSEAESVQVFDRGAHTIVLLHFQDKAATLNYSRNAPFTVDSVPTGEGRSIYRRIESGEYFYHLIKAVLTFFESKVPPFPADETIAAIAIRDAVIRALQEPMGTIVKIEK